MALPKLTKTSNAFSPFTFERGRFLPINEPLSPNQSIGVAGGGALKIADHGQPEQLHIIVMNNVSSTNRNNLLGFFADTTVNYYQNTFTFTDEDGADRQVYLWKAEGLDAPRVRGGNYNIRLIFRDKLPADSVSQPSFSAYTVDAGENVAHATYETMNWATEEWDTHEVFSSGIFMPTAAGKYLFTGHIWLTSGDIVVSNFLVLVLHKNGGKIHESAMRYSGTDHFEGPNIAAIGDANGTTDYFEMRVYQITNLAGAKNTLTSGEVGDPLSIFCYFQGIGMSANGLSRPSFSVSQSAAQTNIVTTTDTKMEWDVEEYDDTNDFTSHRFTPTTAGIYIFTANAWLAADAVNIARGVILALKLYKNGVEYKQCEIKYAGTGNFEGPPFCCLAEANGSSDYFELFIHQQTGVNQDTITSPEIVAPESNYVYWQGHLVSDARFPMPAFSAYQGTSQTGLADQAYTKILFNTTDFDTHSNWAGNKFTPTVAGKYIITGKLWLDGPNFADNKLLALIIYKNGNQYKQGEIHTRTSGNFQGPSVTCVVDMNGTTDYIELFCYQEMGAAMDVDNSAPLSLYTFFQGVGVP